MSKKHFRPSRIIVPLLLSGAFGCGGVATPEGSGEDAVGTSQAALSEVAVAVTSAEYKFDATTDPEVISDRATELWAKVWRPAVLTTRYPVVMFLHGNHATCGHDSNPRIDDNCQYTIDGTCPPGFVVAPSHAGYDYIAQDLAAQGYIVVSVNANRGINCDSGPADDPFLNLTRGRLVLKHLEVLSQWNRGAAPTPSSLGVSLQNRLDLNRVSMMGHSRGGEGVRAAYAQYLDVGSPWPSRIVDPVAFRRIFEIGPVDGQTTRTLNANNLPWAVLLPMCDGDVSDLEGIRPFDRMEASTSESPPSMKASFTVWGACHNYYNTEWQQAEGGAACTGPGNIALFTSGPGITGSATQRTTAHDSLLNFFQNPPGTFDPLNPVLPTISAITRVDRGFTPSSDSRVTKRLEDFTNPTGTSTYGLPNEASGITIVHQTLPEHDPTLQGGSIEWTSAGSGTFFQTNFAPPGAGMDLRSYAYLDLRVDRADSSLNPTGGATHFSVQLVDDTDAVSAARPISSYLSLTGPVGGPFNRHSMLQTARIPLSSFALSRLNAVRGVRVTFDRTASGAVYLANLRATRATCGTVPKLDLKVRQVVRNANQVQFRVQVFNRDAAPVRMSDLAVKLWISDPTTSLSAPVYFAGNVYDGSGAFRFTSSGATGATTQVVPSCTHAPNRIANWGVTLSTSDARNLPANGGAWVDTEISVNRTDWSNFQSFADDFSQTPAYQGGVVSDRTWPNIYGDDPYFVLYYRGTPVVAEYVSPTATDPSSGMEPSCISRCVAPTGGIRAAVSLNAAEPTEEYSSPPAVTSLASSTAGAGTVKRAARVVRMVSTNAPALVAGGIDLEISSDTPFPVGGSAPVLIVGKTEVAISRYTDPNDLRRLTFTLSPEQFAGLGGGEPMTVRYTGGSGVQWDVGPLDKTILGK